MITKLGSDLIKEAFLGQAALKGISAGFGLFKNNIIPAMKTVGRNTPQALGIAKNTILGRFGGTLGQNIPKAVMNAGGSIKAALRPDQLKALSYGAKGLGVLGTGAVVGMAANAGNKDYKQKMQEINRFKQYQINPNIPQGDVAEAS